MGKQAGLGLPFYRFGRENVEFEGRSSRMGGARRFLQLGMRSVPIHFFHFSRARGSEIPLRAMKNNE
jgi:hypothetical protein